MAEFDDAYCLKIRRWGAFGIEEDAGKVEKHVVRRDEVEQWLETTMNTLGPGDKAVVTISRGVQHGSEA